MEYLKLYEELFINREGELTSGHDDFDYDVPIHNYKQLKQFIRHLGFHKPKYGNAWIHNLDNDQRIRINRSKKKKRFYLDVTNQATTYDLNTGRFFLDHFDNDPTKIKDKINNILNEK